MTNRSNMTKQSSSTSSSRITHNSTSNLPIIGFYFSAPDIDLLGTSFSLDLTCTNDTETSPTAGSVYRSLNNNALSTDTTLAAHANPDAPYSCWNVPEAPLSAAHIENIFLEFANKYGFQRDSMYNMYHHLMTMLDSRSARMSTTQALWSLHADYIGGEHANYRKWYFAAQLDLDEQAFSTRSPSGQLLVEAKREWRERMETMSNRSRVAQLALYLLIWGEAAILRYMPESLCFIFKLAEDYREVAESSLAEELDPGSFLDNVITPLYRFARDQSYTSVHGQYVRLEKDHNNTIGYDDINQLFWDRRAIARLRLRQGSLLHDIAPCERFNALVHVDWSSAFCKTFYETRSWLHLITNFSRFWIIHACIFWYYMAANVDFIYTSDIKKELPVKLSIIALGGLVAVLIMMTATVAEFMYLPMSKKTAKILLARLFFLALLTLCHVLVTVYVIQFDRSSKQALIISSCHLGFGAIAAIVLAVLPPVNLFHQRQAEHQLTSKTFTANFPQLNNDDRFLSILLWVCVFGCKFLETYFFLALSFRDAIAATVTMRLRDCAHDAIFGRWLCTVLPVVTSILMFMVELVLFFLDTYLWYVIWNTMFSVAQAIRQGISIMISWKTLFARLPQHMYDKITATTELGSGYLRKVACSQMWNAIVISMYREHLLSINNLQYLLYQAHITSDSEGVSSRELRSPPLFDPSSETKKEDCFPPYCEAERRLSFFAQSLATDIPMPTSVERMPTFTVFTPHYAEKLLLSLREIIREEDYTTRVTLLEYLKRLHPAEWNNFVKDTKFIAEEDKLASRPDEKDDLPFYCIGFKSSAPEYQLRTRVWASLRAQTLYRTVSGFMNYARALKILYRIEHPELADEKKESEVVEDRLDRIAHQKFRFLVAMQRYAKFSSEEAENCEYLLEEYPHLQIAYIEEEEDKSGGEPTYYSVLIDGNCEKLPNHKRRPRYRVRLPGNPILGDGKSDNQNHALIFYRGEYLQLVDANQDNYLEECLKIRSIFGEFEQDEAPDLDEIYALSTDLRPAVSPVAIVGAREYIFSENVGVLGDVAAGKEQTFGTLTQRIMAKTGGRLHYGHPDFLNAVFMTTRGGVSKAQRGLHLNEDIYAGMNALCRGGRIKHTEYLQCGKGRDLGFCSILNFTTKIGTGMGEQLLSREYYYLGTQLPLDRFLTFYYGHPGFHINNIMIIFAVQAFLFCMTLVGTMAASLPHCRRDNCFNVRPVYDWLERCILSIFMVFFIAFMPLFLQELTEKGTHRSVWRLIKQFLSLSPLFEVFVTQIYANSLLSNLSFGGARYIATGRGFATSRLPFSVLYSRFANPSIYFGARSIFMLFFVSLTLWIPHLFYFWATVTSLVISPFIFNPHQFVFMDFINDYREFLGWLSRGNAHKHHAHSWITFCRQIRTRVTGHKKKAKHLRDDNTPIVVVPRAQLSSIFASEILMPLLQAVLIIVCYAFAKNREVVDTETLLLGQITLSEFDTGGPVIRLIILAVTPLAWNALTLLFFQAVSVSLSMMGFSTRIGFYIAGLAHACALLGLALSFEYFWALEQYALRSTLLGLLSAFAIQRFIFKTLTALFLTRELHHDATNRTWWTGKWRGTQLGRSGAREYVCKIVEMSMFSTDFILGHLILFGLFPLTLIPSADRLHSLMLFWLRPSHQIRPSVLPMKQRRRRRQIALIYGPVFGIVFLCFAIFIAIPPLLARTLDLPISPYTYY